MKIKQMVKAFLGVKPNPEPATKLPKMDLPAILPDFKTKIEILEPGSANGNVTIHELFSLNFLVAACAPKVLFEIAA